MTIAIVWGTPNCAELNEALAGAQTAFVLVRQPQHPTIRWPQERGPIPSLRTPEGDADFGDKRAAPRGRWLELDFPTINTCG
jgi:hypothetical protein